MKKSHYLFVRKHCTQVVLVLASLLLADARDARADAVSKAIQNIKSHGCELFLGREKEFLCPTDPAYDNCVAQLGYEVPLICHGSGSRKAIGGTASQLDAVLSQCTKSGSSYSCPYGAFAKCEAVKSGGANITCIDQDAAKHKACTDLGVSLGLYTAALKEAVSNSCPSLDKYSEQKSNISEALAKYKACPSGYMEMKKVSDAEKMQKAADSACQAKIASKAAAKVDEKKHVDKYCTHDTLGSGTPIYFCWANAGVSGCKALYGASGAKCILDPK